MKFYYPIIEILFYLEHARGASDVKLFSLIDLDKDWHYNKCIKILSIKDEEEHDV